MKEFPKMLYHDQQTYITVATGKEEDAARKNGYMDYADLPEHEAGVEGGSSVGSGAITDTLNARIAELEAENETLRAKVADYEKGSDTPNAQKADSGLDGVSTGKAGANAKAIK